MKRQGIKKNAQGDHLEDGLFLIEIKNPEVFKIGKLEKFNGWTRPPQHRRRVRAWQVTEGKGKSKVAGR